MFKEREKKLREQIWKKKKRQKILFMYMFGSANEKNGSTISVVTFSQNIYFQL